MNQTLSEQARTAGAVLAGALLMAAAGCRTFPSKSDKEPPAQTASTPGAPAPGTPRTDFQREVGAEQQYNVHMDLGKLYENQGQIEAAVGEYTKAVDLTAKRGSVLGPTKFGASQQANAERRLAAAFDKMGRFTQADVHYNKALKAAPTDPKVWNDVGYSYYLQNRWADAERALKTADQIEPSNPRVLTNLGLTLAAQGKDSDALTAFTRAAGPAVGHANLGFILAALGRPEAAQSHYREALQIQPDLKAAQVALAKLDAENRASSIASAPSAPPTQASTTPAGRPVAAKPMAATPAQVASAKPASRSATPAAKPAATTSTTAVLSVKDAGVARTAQVSNPASKAQAPAKPQEKDKDKSKVAGGVSTRLSAPALDPSTVPTPTPSR
jgi:Flp pilus assembly protein TadD